MKSFFTTIIVLLIAGAGAYYYLQLEKAEDQVSRTEKTESLQVPEDTTPEIQHPIAEAPEITGSSTEVEEPLPPLEESDNKVKEILSEIIGSDLIKKFFRESAIIHRFVVTVDSLPTKEIPLKYRLLPPASEKLLVQKDTSDKVTLDPENFKRYDAFIQLLGKIDTDQFVKWYTRFYPLIQEDYDSLGYKNKYFNDRFIAVIDHLLETPEATGPLVLVQPRVFYEFADPALQNLSAGQKTLLRIGPANTAIVKARLIDIKKSLTASQPDN